MNVKQDYYMARFILEEISLAPVWGMGQGQVGTNGDKKASQEAGEITQRRDV